MRLPALILLATFAACAASSAEQIVGVWRPDANTTDVVRANLQAESANRAHTDGRFEISFVSPPSGPEFDEEFREDGTCGIAFFLGTNRSLPWSWRIVDQDDSRIVIEQRLADRVDQRTFVFESPDVIREVGGLSDGVRMRRVK